MGVLLVYFLRVLKVFLLFLFFYFYHSALREEQCRGRTLLSSCVYVTKGVMDQYCLPGAGKTLRPGVSREQAMIYLLALAKDKPVIVNRVAALMKVTAAATNI